MAKKICYLLPVSLFLWSGIIFAANWVFFAEGNNPPYGNCDTYVDQDSVVKNGNDVVFWEQDILDKIDQTGGKKYFFKIEAVTSNPRQYRLLEYDIDDTYGKVIYFNTTPAKFNPVNQRYDQEIDFALRCAKAEQDAGQKSMGFDYVYQSGFYLRKVRGTVKDPQGLWQALLLLQPPPGARGGYGLIGNDSLRRQAPGSGLRQLGKIARQYLTFDFFYVMQPPGFKEIGVQSGKFTSLNTLNDTTLGWVFFDLRPKFEADLKKFLNLTP